MKNSIPKKNKIYAFQEQEKDQEKDQLHTTDRCAENMAFMIATYLKGH